MEIRVAERRDMIAILAIYEIARNYMRENGNPFQWGDSHPSAEMVEEDIALGRSYVLIGNDGNVHGVFVFIIGEDPTYHTIYEGQWLNDDTYGVIHRIASDGKQKGLFANAISFCKENCRNVRIDTHADNRTMQHLIEKNGFQRCGVIYIEDGSSRIAYQSVD
ncbi:MAG: GNAT family N-acetyltransferase [Oscillospiraceae bacterium]|jgi:RimJ/RimL family protein N-acetyltransferase